MPNDIDQNIEIDPKASRSAIAATAPSASGWGWQSVVALLGSTGLISVFGPIIGEMYWEGFLEAFGLTPHEFPAAAARINVYAYLTIIEAIANAWNYWTDALWWWTLLVVGGVAATVVVEHLSRGEWWKRIRGGLHRQLTDDTLQGTAARAGLSSLIASFLVAAMFAVAVLTLAVALGPVFAQKSGLRDGQALRAKIIASTKASPSVCDRIVGGQASSCPRAIAFNADTVAVLDAGEIRRLRRSGLEFSTSLPVGQ